MNNDALKDLKKIRDSGKFNMFTQREEIMLYANKNNMYCLVIYAGNSPKRYMELLENLD